MDYYQAIGLVGLVQLISEWLLGLRILFWEYSGKNRKQKESGIISE